MSKSLPAKEERLAEKGFPGRGNPKNKAVEVRNG